MEENRTIICKVGWLVGFPITYYILHRLVLFLVWNLDWKWFHTIPIGFLIHSRHSFWTERKFLMEFILHCIKLLIDKEDISIWVCEMGVFYTRVLLQFIHSFIFSTDLVFAVIIRIYLWRIPSSSVPIPFSFSSSPSSSSSFLFFNSLYYFITNKSKWIIETPIIREEEL